MVFEVDIKSGLFKPLSDPKISPLRPQLTITPIKNETLLRLNLKTASDPNLENPLWHTGKSRKKNQLQSPGPGTDQKWPLLTLGMGFIMILHPVWPVAITNPRTLQVGPKVGLFCFRKGFIFVVPCEGFRSLAWEGLSHDHFRPNP